MPRTDNFDLLSVSGRCRCRL